MLLRSLQRYAAIAVLGASALLTSCSSVSEFVFFNGTSAPFSLTYTLLYPGAVPALAEQVKGPWRELPPTDYDVSQQGTLLSFEVPPGLSARLASAYNYPGHNLRGLEVFPIVSLTVADELSAVTVEGARALLAFERRSDGLYVFPAREIVVRER